MGNFLFFSLLENLNLERVFKVNGCSQITSGQWCTLLASQAVLWNHWLIMVFSLLPLWVFPFNIFVVMCTNMALFKLFSHAQVLSVLLPLPVRSPVQKRIKATRYCQRCSLLANIRNGFASYLWFLSALTSLFQCWGTSLFLWKTLEIVKDSDKGWTDF